jgi:hypothetical protein
VEPALIEYDSGEWDLLLKSLVPVIGVDVRGYTLTDPVPIGGTCSYRVWFRLSGIYPYYLPTYCSYRVWFRLSGIYAYYLPTEWN